MINNESIKNYINKRSKLLLNYKDTIFNSSNKLSEINDTSSKNKFKFNYNPEEWKETYNEIGEINLRPIIKSINIILDEYNDFNEFIITELGKSYNEKKLNIIREEYINYITNLVTNCIFKMYDKYSNIVRNYIIINLANNIAEESMDKEQEQKQKTRKTNIKTAA